MEMPELPIPRSEKKKKKSPQQQFSNFLIPILILFSSFILSHPLYFLKFLSFLSPLLVTTFLILLFTSYRAFRRSSGNGIVEKGEVEVQSCEEDEVYKIFFEAPRLEDGRQEEPVELVDKFLICGDTGNLVTDQLELEDKKLQEKEDGDIDNGDEKKDGSTQVEKTLEELFKEKEDGECEAVTVPAVKEKEEEVTNVGKADTEAKNSNLGRSKTEECASRAWRNSRRLSNSLRISEKSAGVLEDDEKMGLVLGGFGSMRRTEKEWKRTLACKLFEERHSNGEAGGGGDEEEMDMLWETYEKCETPASQLPEPDHGKKSAKESAKKMRKKVEEDEEEDDDGEEEEEMNRQFCCLQALKLSAGKVNLGMGKPNIARISKAFRGIGWLHHGRARKGLLH